MQSKPSAIAGESRRARAHSGSGTILDWPSSHQIDGASVASRNGTVVASVSDWVEEISRVWARGPASTLELARVVSVARNELPHGAWSSLWKKSGQMPFSKRQGYLLLTIGDGLGWANVHTCAHLPAGVRTLHHMARLNRDTIDRLIQEGVIHPALKESEAKRLLAQFQGKTAEDTQAKSRILQRLRRFEEFVRDTLSDWTAMERQRATEGLTQLLEQIRRAAGAKRNGAVSDFAGGLLNHHRNSL